MRSVLFILLMFLYYSGNAQITIGPYFPNQDVRKMIAGATNTFVIKGLPKNAILKMKGIVTRLDDTTFQFKKSYSPCYNIPPDTLKIFVKSELVFEKAFRVEKSTKQPDPMLIIGYDLCKETWTNKDFKGDVFLNIYPECSGCKVDSFYWCIVPKRGEVVGPFFVKGNKLVGREWEGCQKRLKNDRFYFEAFCNGCKLKTGNMLTAWIALKYVE